MHLLGPARSEQKRSLLKSIDILVLSDLLQLIDLRAFRVPCQSPAPPCRTSILRKLGHIDAEGLVLLKGRAACEVRKSEKRKDSNTTCAAEESGHPGSLPKGRAVCCRASVSHSMMCMPGYLSQRRGAAKSTMLAAMIALPCRKPRATSQNFGRHTMSAN